MTECDGWVDFMVIFRARSVALAGAIAVGVLCEALISAPAQAQTFVGAFGNTTDLDATLKLFNSSGALVATVSTDSSLGIFQGFISNTDPGTSVVPSVGGPNGTNTSYAVGSYNGMLLVDYLGFNLASLPSTVTSITSATLVMESGKVTNDLTYTLFGATQWVNQLETPADQNAALYAAMVKTVSSGSYGSFQVAQNTNNPMAQLVFLLQGSAVADINAAIAAKGVFVIAGEASAPVPEPSTWVMMLAGFAGLGIAARRRAAKRRAAAAAG
jgi:PEP-CTERM motif-containing protein